MNHERNLGRNFSIKVNGGRQLTTRGRLAIELVRIDTLLRNHNDPKINFAMSDEMVNKYALRRLVICKNLKIPQEDRKIIDRRIASYKKKLNGQGFPHWKVS